MDGVRSSEPERSVEAEVGRFMREEGANEHEALVLYHLYSLYDAWQAMLKAKYSSDQSPDTPPATDSTRATMSNAENVSGNEAKRLASKTSFQEQYMPLLNAVLADIHRREHPFLEEDPATRSTHKIERPRDPQEELERLNGDIDRLKRVVAGELAPEEDERLRALLKDYGDSEEALINLKVQRDDLRTELEEG